MKRRSHWTQAHIAETKEWVKSYLDQPDFLADPAKRLEAALFLIGKLEGDSSELAPLKRFIACMSAAIHHIRNDGLKNPQINLLFEVAHTILRVSGINPQESVFAYLYGEIHLIKGQVLRKQGVAWSAAWEQLLAMRYIGQGPDQDRMFHLHALANRMQRLGDNESAVRLLQNLVPSATKAQRGKILVSLIIGHRLSGRSDEAEALAKESSQGDELPAAYRLEAAWELMCLQLMKDHDLNSLLKATRKGSTHHQPSYMVEAVLWGMALKKKDWLEKVSSLKSLRRNSSLKPQNLGPMFKIAEAIQAVYDTEIPFALRLEHLGDALGMAGEVINIDRELLCWVAAARALVRMRSFEFAGLCLSRYRFLSRTVSNMQSDDILGLAADLLSARWYRERFIANDADGEKLASSGGWDESA